MATVTGMIEATNSKDVNTRFGPKKTYSVLVSGEWYNCGFKDPHVVKGDEVLIMFSEDKYGKKADSITIHTSTGKAASEPAGKHAGPSDDRQAAIIRQNSLAHATAIVVASRGAKETRDQMVKEVIRLARAFVAFSDGTLEALAESEATDTILSEE